MTSAGNSVSEPPNLKIFWGKISPELSTRLVPSALAILPPPPLVTKNLATALLAVSTKLKCGTTKRWKMTRGANHPQMFHET